jgi:glucose-1-phosphate adenylyltransferase
VAVFGGDHIYKFAIDQMEHQHRRLEADLTIAACPVPRSQAREFGVIQIDSQSRIIGFEEKPDHPATIPGRPDTCLVSMGNYIFGSKVLLQALDQDAADPKSTRDFGRDVIPRLLKTGKKIYAYDFGENHLPGEPDGLKPYWRDVGSLDSFVAANMEVRSNEPSVNLYNRRWRVRTAQRDYPPSRFIAGPQGQSPVLLDCLVCEGSIVSSAYMARTVLGYDCHVDANSDVRDCVFFSGCNVGMGAQVHGVVLDKNCSIAPGAQIGIDPKADAARFPFRSPGGIIALPKGTHVPAEGPIAFARDMALMLQQDPATQEAMERLAGKWTIAERVDHSYDSSGPRFRTRQDRGIVLDGRER